MPLLRHLAVLFAFLAAFVRPAPASAVMPAGAGTREGIGAAYDENASSYRFAARSATAQEVAAQAWKFTTTNEGTSIIVRGGL